MTSVCSLSDEELLARLSNAVFAERMATADVIEHLVELDRRQLHLREACGSLTSYCIERLGYSEDSAGMRVRVARLVQQCPRALQELRSGAIHLTGLYLLARHLTADNAERLLAQARGKSRRELQELIAHWFPRPDVLPSIAPTGGSTAAPPTACSAQPRTDAALPIRTGTDRSQMEPLSAASFRVEFTASRELREKIERAQNLLSHAIPSRDLAGLFERAIDALLETEMKRRFGAGDPGKSLTRGKRRKRRAVAPASRHVPVDVVRVVWQRDGGQCTYTDTEGRRCSEQRFVTIEHIQPHALGGPATAENLCLLCSAHNALRAREVFGEDHVRQKIAEAGETEELTENAPTECAPTECAPTERAPTEPAPDPDATADESSEKIHGALVRLGFRTAEARRAVRRARAKGVAPGLESFFRAALAELTPDASSGRC